MILKAKSKLIPLSTPSSNRLFNRAVQMGRESPLLSEVATIFGNDSLCSTCFVSRVRSGSLLLEVLL